MHDDARGRQHHIKCEMDFRPRALEKALHLGAKPVNSVETVRSPPVSTVTGLALIEVSRRFSVEQRDAGVVPRDWRSNS